MTPSDNSHYGLGYAHLLQGDHDSARTAFSLLSNDSQKAEGLAAVAHAKDGEGARETLVAAAATSAYAKTLVASLDLVAAEYGAVIAELTNAASVQASKHAFDWQRARALTTLGRAHFKLKNFSEAQAAFNAAAELAPSDGGTLAGTTASAYLSLVERQMDNDLMDENIEKAKDLGERIKSREITVQSNEELWTSRPVRFLILQPDVGKRSRYARESGLEDYFPDLLGEAMNATGRYEWVDRDALDIVLAEQTLSSLLSAEGDQAKVGRLMGARVVIKGQFRSLISEELSIKMTNAETTSIIPFGEALALAGQMNPHDVTAEASERVQAAFDAAFPIRGRLTRSDAELSLDVGAKLGISPGKRFALFREPSQGLRSIADAAAVVEKLESDEKSLITLEGGGLTPDDIPPEGLYVIEEQWYLNHGAGKS
jgi:tetratricopeptide (TPR) repeat protein